MGEQLSLEDITGRAWSLHRPNGDCRSPMVLLEDGGKVVGYEHPNEASWAPHVEGFAFLSREGRITSVSGEIRRSESGAFRIRMVNPDLRDRTAHVLFEIGKDSRPQAAQPAASDTAAQARSVAIAFASGPITSRIEVCAPDAAAAFLDPRITRVFFIANNKDIAPAVFESWDPGATDIVVQYNRPAHFEALTRYSCHKVHFFSPNTRSCWGFMDDARPELQYDEQPFCSLTFAVAHWIPSSVRPYFEGLQARARHMAIVPDRHIALYCYPAGKSPSAGFMSVAFFRSLNWIRRQQGHKPLELAMIGFTGVYGPGKAWPGHDFAFEQQVYATWLDLRRLNIDGSIYRGTPLAASPFSHAGLYSADADQGLAACEGLPEP